MDWIHGNLESVEVEEAPCSTTPNYRNASADAGRDAYTVTSSDGFSLAHPHPYPTVFFHNTEHILTRLCVRPTLPIMASIRFTFLSLVSLASLASALPALGEFKFQGCYTDTGLAGKQLSDHNMTLKMCAATCEGSGYQWFGVESGTECFCGDSLASTAEKRPDSECSMKCGGSKCQKCGDIDRIGVFWSGRGTTSASELPTTSDATSAAESTTTGAPETSETTTSTEATTTLPAEESTAAVPEVTTTTLPTEESTTSAPEIISTTSTPEITSTLPAEEPTTTTPCELTTVYLPTPSNCWASIPTPCVSLNRTPTLAYILATAPASQCRNAFLAQATVVPEIASCFTDLSSPAKFAATAAYTCVANADVYCQSTTLCKADATVGAPAGPVATNVLGEGGFEDAQLWPSQTNSGADDVISTSVSTDMAHSGTYSLKTVFSNTNGGSRAWTKSVRLTPGATYELSLWFWSENAQASTVVRTQFSGGGVSFVYDVATLGQPTGQWVRASKTFTPLATSGTVYFSVYGNKAAAANQFYVDDISIVQIE